MARSPSPDQLAKLIQSLRAKRAAHIDAIAELDSLFEQYGISAEGAGNGRRKKRGRPPKNQAADGQKVVRKEAGRKKAATKKVAKKKVGRGRGKYRMSGDEAVLKFVTKRGNPTTSEINKFWQSKGRGGSADNSLSALTKDGKLKRENIPNARGSRYRVE